MTANYDVVVIGAGIVGLTAAITMQQRGFSVALIDAGAIKAQENNRVYAINAASKRLFSSLNVWSLLEPQSLSPYKKMQVWDAKSGASIGFDARLAADPQLGFILAENTLKKALIQALTAIDLFPDSPVEKMISADTGMQIFSATKHWHADLVMIADGANSPFRKQLEIPLTQWSYQQQALVATVETEKSHEQTAYQVFHKEGPLAFLPLANPHHCSIVWTTQPNEAKALMGLSEDAFNLRLTTAFAATLGKTQLVSPRSVFPLSMRHAQKYAGDHWLLLGDAAHTIHPLAGLGLNLGLTDITTFRDLLGAQKNLLLTATTLGKYQRQRKSEVWQIIAVMEALKQLFCSDFTPLVTLRSFGLRAFDSIIPFKRRIMAEAMGL